MSGTLTNPGSLAALIDGLFAASFRGIEFHVVDARHEAGRRVLAFLFPGRDTVLHEDLGATPDVITITGLVVGEDYVRRAERLERAFRTAGPATLSHPWLGEVEVVLVEPAQIRFSDRELRVARIDATFERWQPEDQKLDTLGRLLAAIDNLRDQARSLLRRVLAPVRLVLGVITTVTSFVGSAATAWRGAVNGVRGGGTLRGAVSGATNALAGFTLDLGSSDPGAGMATTLATVPAAAVSAATLPPTPAIGPGITATTTVAAEARVAAELLLTAAAALAEGPAETAALRSAAVAQVLASAAQLTIDIRFDSRGQARAWRGRVDAAIADAIARAAVLAAQEPEGAGLLLDALQGLRIAALADLDDRIGRLPDVVRVTVPAAGTSAWLVAQHLAGDEPARVVQVYRDLVARNAIAHPAVIGGGAVLEALP